MSILRYKRQFLVSLTLLAIGVGALSFSVNVFAQGDTFGLQEVGQTVELGGDDIRVTIARILRAALGLLGIIAIGIVLYGGFVYMTSGGAEDKIATAKKILINGGIGLVIILSAFSITQFILTKLGQATGILGDGSSLSSSCSDISYAYAHKQECGIPLIGGAGGCLDTTSEFVAKSITPVTNNTHMNNTAVRVLFNKPIALSILPSDVFTVSKSGVSQKDLFTYSPLTDITGARFGVEAKLNNTAPLCSDGITRCLPSGLYGITVHNITSASGAVLTEESTCGNFPKNASFTVESASVAPSIISNSILYISFDESTIKDAGILNDASKQDNNGVVIAGANDNAEKSVPGVIGAAMAFDGVDDAVSFPHSPTFGSSAANFSLSLYARPDTFDTTKVLASGGITAKTGWVLFTRTEEGQTTIGFEINLENGHKRAFGPIQPGVFNHVLAQFDAASQTPTLFINGIKFDSKDQAILLSNLGDTFFLGKRTAGIENLPFQGALDQFVVYNDIVSPETAKTPSAADTTPPEVALTVNGSAVEQTVSAGSSAAVVVTASDASGIGYGHIVVSSVKANASTPLVDTFFGSTVSETSDAPKEKPKKFLHTFPLPKNMEAGAYTIDVTVYDIDNNPASVEIAIKIAPEHCTDGIKNGDETDTDAGGSCGGAAGAACTQTAECAYGLQCVEKICTKHPLIEGVDPMNGAVGNWITIIGKNFGTVAGTVEFGNEKTNTWVTAPIVSCGVSGNAWTDSYIVVSVPDAPAVTNGDESTIRVTLHDADTSDAKTPLFDTTTNTFLPNASVPPLPSGGLFLHTNVKRPGLCSVSAGTASAAEPGKPVLAVGTAFGQTQGASTLLFGSLASQITQWSDTQINASVPANLSAGTVAVKVSVAGEISNGVPFTVLFAEGNTQTAPQIFSIAPASVSPESFLTLTGAGFGHFVGSVYIADSIDHALTCGTPTADATCVSLNVTNFPEGCVGTWTDTQVIAEMPKGTKAGAYHVVLKNHLGFKTSGTETITVTSAPPSPALCTIVPAQGPAPTPQDGTGIQLIGKNFSNNPTVYFWAKDAATSSFTGWLSQTGKVITIGGTGNKLTTPIPSKSGHSMVTGPIVVAADTGRVSNPITYSVNDCRAAGLDEQKAFDASGFQCCASGSDTGLWVAGACEGETLSAGYVWRFSSGIIPSLPHVVESCNENVWNTPGAIASYPSPIPWREWKQGMQACTNSTVAVRFSTPMNPSTIHANSVLVYFCGTGLEPKCIYEPADQIKNLNTAYQSQVLEIIKGSFDKKGILAENTWYRVLLTKDIQSTPQAIGAGAEAPLPLSKTNGLPKDDVYSDPDSIAYTYDFKTGSALCLLQNAAIIPDEKTVTGLGPILDGPNPFYYLLKGQGDQECSILSVDGLGWSWSANPSLAAQVLLAPDKNYADTRATATALTSAPPPAGVAIQASANLSQTKFFNWIDILAAAKVSAPYTVSNTETVVQIVDTGKDGLYDFVDPFTLDISFSVSKVGNKKILEKLGGWSLSVVQNKLCFQFSASGNTLCHQPVNGFSVGVQYHYVITWNGKRLVMMDAHTAASQNVLGGVDTDSALFLGGSGVQPFPVTFYTLRMLDGTALTAYLAKSIFSANKQIDATSSTLYITLGPPTVVDYWPNCGESCVNAGIGATFNRDMMVKTYADKGIPGMALYICDSELCYEGNPPPEKKVGMTIDLEHSDARTIRAYPNGDLHQNKWYLVKVKPTILSVGGFTKDGTPLAGAALTPFSWKFKTQDNASACVADSAVVQPLSFTATAIGQKTLYQAIPKTSGNTCDPDGQELDPSEYGWSWSSADPLVANVSTFAFSGEKVTACTSACLPLGSDIVRGTAAADAPICGDGIVENGEDCDIAAAGEVAGVSCSFSCLRPGNSKASCGNGTVETAFGELCDEGGEKISWKSCTAACLYTGSPVSPPGADVNASWCGSGEVTSGEVCDTNDPKTKEGCSAACLHLGTPLSQAWCDNTPGSSSCLDAVSVCGNGILETGESCEFVNDTTVRIPLSNATHIDVLVDFAVNYCTNTCIAKNLCGLSSVPTISLGSPGSPRCQSGTEGCDDNSCTLLGASAFYDTPSQCGDAVVGIGEFGLCEVSSQSSLGQNPVQLVSAVGNGILNSDTQLQSTVISASMLKQKQPDGSAAPVPKQPSGSSAFTLACGFVEYDTPIVISNDVDDIVLSNNCPNNNDNALGVNAFSCCTPRPIKTENYPADGAGITGAKAGVCRNTAISVTFDKEILVGSVQGNVMLASGHAAGFDCLSIGAQFVTDQVFAAANTEPFGFWGRLWARVTSFFIRLFGSTVHATGFKTYVSQFPVWCAGDIAIDPTVVPITNADGAVEGSTVLLHSTQALAAQTPYAVILSGGKHGVVDVQNVGIVGGDATSWVFKTGSDICTLDSVSAEPKEYLFTAPFTTTVLNAVAKSASGQLLAPVDEYGWLWQWGPTNHPIFDIPAGTIAGTFMETSAIEVGVADVPGSTTAVVNAVISTDIISGSAGKSLSDSVDLVAEFCEHPWRVTDAVGTQVPFEDATYNFSFSYCADAGVVGNANDNLPFLSMVEITDPFELGQYSASGTVQAADLLKRYFFFNEKNNDVIGVQIIKNPKRLSASEWFADAFGTTAGLAPLSIDGYDAVKDSNTFYVNALNIAESGTAYNNIYVFSINGNATSETAAVFEKILSSLAFNTNLTNFGYCGVSNTQPDFSIAAKVCTSDFDCQGIAKTTLVTPEVSVCSVDAVGSWGTQISSTDKKLYDIDMVGLFGMAVGAKGTALRTEDGGKTWVSMTLPSALQSDLHAVDVFNTNIAMVGGDKELFQTIDGGSTWKLMTLPNSTTFFLRDIVILSENVSVVVGSKGGVYRIENGAATQIASGVTGVLLGVDMRVARGWIVGVGGIILRSTNTGKTWSQVAVPANLPPNSNSFRDVFFVNTVTGWIVGDNGVILKSNDTGNTWTPQNSPTTEELQEVWFLNIQEGYIVGANGTLLHTSDGGLNWFVEPVGVNNSLFGIAGASAETLWLAGANGTIVHHGDYLLACSADTPCTAPNTCVTTAAAVSETKTAPICAVEKIKLQRDWQRINDIHLAQNNLQSHFVSGGSYPALSAGTFLPGYTNSRWPSWGTLGATVGFLPSDPLNLWSECSAGDQQTCWDAANQTFHCPANASIYEYRFDPVQKNYTLHAPLEYFTENAVESQFGLDAFGNGFIVNPASFTTARGCESNIVYSPFAGQCGDGVLNPEFEACDPPGNAVLQSSGFSAATTGVCSVGYMEDNNVCGANVDCGSVWTLGIDDGSGKKSYKVHKNGKGLCVSDNIVLYDFQKKEVNGAFVGISCIKDAECETEAFYQSKTTLVGSFGNTPLQHGAGSNSDFFVDFLNNNTVVCAEPSDLIIHAGDPPKPVSLSSFNAGKCSGLGTQQFGQCSVDEYAIASCNATCSGFDYGSCQSKATCNNGTVEAPEKCDDGKKNGTYGHCNDQCTGLFGAYCGNGTLDGTNEICDWSVKDAGGNPQWTLYNKTDPSKSCALDCQDLGGFCGDGIKDSVEQCDKESGTTFEKGCTADCTFTNLACISSGAQIALSQAKNKTYVFLTKYDTTVYPQVVANVEDVVAGTKFIAGKEHIAACFQNTTGKEICGALGLTCDKIAQTNKNSPFTETLSCDSSFAIFQSGFPTQNTYTAVCNGLANQETLVGGAASTCGNGIKDSGETCDLGGQNGVACTPPYGDSCTYCAADCKNILTKDAPAYCGNETVDTVPTGVDESGNNIFEQCDYLNGNTSEAITASSTPQPLVCADIGAHYFGAYACVKTCSVLSNSCVDCGKNEGGAKAQVSIIHPMLNILKEPAKSKSQADTYADAGAMLWAENNTTGAADGFLGGLKITQKTGVGILGDTIDQTNQFGVQSVSQCNGHYSLAFHDFAGATETDRDLFDYPVDNEGFLVNNDYVYSPPVPPSVIRVVLRWETVELGANAMFAGGFYSNGKKWVRYSDVLSKGSGFMCNDINTIPVYGSDYAWPTTCSVFGPEHPGIYTHYINQSKGTRIQSYTIDTNAMNPINEPIAFFVESLSGPIGAESIKKSNLRVEVYTYHAGQNSITPIPSIFKPTHVFPIKTAAGTSDGAAAKYWYVFDIGTQGAEVNSISPVFTPAGSIEGDDIQLLNAYDFGPSQIDPALNLPKYANIHIIP